jgi:hypothetical protein
MAFFSKMKQPYIRFLSIALTAILVALVFNFAFRDEILKKAVHKKTDHFNNTHQAKIRFEKVYFQGLNTICFDSILVTPGPFDTLFFIGSLSANINSWQLLAGHVGFRTMKIENARAHFEQTKINSYFRAFSISTISPRTDSSKINLYSSTERLLKRAFVTIPSKLFVKDFSIIYSQDSLSVGWYIDLLELKNEKLVSTVSLIENNQTQTASIEGTVKSKPHTIELSVNPQETGTMLHSPLAWLLGAELGYRSLKINFTEKEDKGKILRLEGNCSIGPFDINHKALSSKTITFPGCSMKLDFSVGPNYLELDSISEINFNRLSLHPFLKYGMEPSGTFIFSCNVLPFAASDFFTSLPYDLFPDLKIFEAEGTLSYRTKLLVDLKQPDSLHLESNLDSKNFKIKLIDGSLFKMNSSFLYTAYEKGKPMRTIYVGPDNPNFRPLSQVPLLLQNIILCSEDNAFYYHKGFSIESIRNAIVKNIKEKKFARGGSTISQQLVKNVYLSREKTISRKLEEIILVWIIESNHLVSKSRMFEVYLNIIEWGPNVYGVNEASHFYFRKDISRLNASECIFLANIIPSPKKFYWRFKEGHPAPFMIAYYKDISEKMYNRGYLSSNNGDSLSSMLNITGPAKDYLRSQTVLIDSVPSLDIPDEELEE